MKYKRVLSKSCKTTLVLAAFTLLPAVCLAAAGDLDLTFGTNGLVTTNFIGPQTGNINDAVIQSDGKIVVVGRLDTAAGLDIALSRYNTDGSLDTTFGDAGKVTTNFIELDYVFAMAIQSDGKIVVVGTAEGDFMLARYNGDGILDTSFGSDGRTTTDFGASNDSANAVAIQSDGRIVVAGSDRQDFALARYNSDGSLDTTFDSDGKVTTNLGSDDDYVYDMVIQSDGKIVVSGYTRTGGPGAYDHNFALARYNSNGSLDSSFGTGGLVITDFDSQDDGDDEFARSLTLQADGKIVVAGNHNPKYGDYDFALARYNSNGSLDTSFGAGGLVTTDFASYDDVVSAVVIQSDGKIVAAGTSRSTSWNNDFALARYNSNGSLDTSFGTGGLVTTDFASYDDWVSAVVIQTDGNIVAAGGANSLTHDLNFSLARYNGVGDLDTSFGTDGLVTTTFTGPNGDIAYDGVAIDSSGKIVLAGSSWGWGSTQNFALARYNNDGSSDNAFDSDGLLTTDFGGNNESATAVAIQADGKIVAVGSGYATWNNTDFLLARYNDDGSLDTAFGIGGLVITDFASSYETAHDVALQADSKIVVVGSSSISGVGQYLALARYNSDGTLDTSFGAGGIVTTDFGLSRSSGQAIVIQTDGKIVVAGSSGTEDSDFALARYNSDGTLDVSFGTGGIVTTDFGGGTEYDKFFDLAIQADGKIVVAGDSWVPNVGNDFVIGRYNSNGSLDTSFGPGGLVTTNFGNDGAYATAVALQPDGKILAAGASYITQINGATNYLRDFALARYNLNGSLDASFGTGGLVITEFGTEGASAYALVLQSDGKIVVAGYSDGGSATDLDFALARYENPSIPDIPGDLDGDGDIDRDDIQIILAHRNQTADACPPCDLDGDGLITVLDARILVTSCTRPGCANE